MNVVDWTKKVVIGSVEYAISLLMLRMEFVSQTLIAKLINSLALKDGMQLDLTLMMFQH